MKEEAKKTNEVKKVGFKRGPYKKRAPKIDPKILAAQIAAYPFRCPDLVQSLNHKFQTLESQQHDMKKT